MTIDSQSTRDTTSTTIPDHWNLIPCVQYGFPDDKGPTREPILRSIFEPIPEEANTVSPVYVLDRDQYERQDQLESGYGIEGKTSIATELQDECQADDRALYPIHIESDEYHEVGPATLIEWFREFSENYLHVPFNTCTLYFSGRRSIHVHVPRFVSGENQRKRLKERAETFCEETSAKLDCGLYCAKRMFRLPAVKHEKTGLWKVETQPEWDHDRIIREASATPQDVPKSYEAVLRRVFGSQQPLTNDTSQTTRNPPHDLFRVLDSEQTVLEFESDEPDIETPLIESKECPDNSIAVKQWTQYNGKEFSPYAYAAENSRSMAALQVKGGAFARRKKRDGATMIPAWFYGAVGCNSTFTKEQQHAPLQLSNRDYRKWNFLPGDPVVIIGGQSRTSKLLDVDHHQARVVGNLLSGDDGTRDDALDYLEAEGYNTGNAGSTTATVSTTTTRDTSTTTNAKRIWTARENPQSKAEKLQRQAEQNGIQTLTHHERIKVACRHLRYGWDPTWEWFQEQFGATFKPQVTWQQLQSIVESYDEYNHVEVPPRP